MDKLARYIVYCKVQSIVGSMVPPKLKPTHTHKRIQGNVSGVFLDMCQGVYKPGLEGCPPSNGFLRGRQRTLMVEGDFSLTHNVFFF